MNATEINEQLAMICPELRSEYATYPLKYDNWLDLGGKSPSGEPVFIASETEDQGFKKHYVYCTRGLKGKGYYHVLTKIAYTNLYTRIGTSNPARGRDASVSQKEAKEAWATTKRIVWNRSRCSRPDDAAAVEQGVNHMTGTKISPFFGLKLW